MIRIAILTFCLVSPALAQHSPAPHAIALPLSVEEQQSLQEVCVAAIRNDRVASAVTYNVAGFCLQIVQRMVQEAVKPLKEPLDGRHDVAPSP